MFENSSEQKTTSAIQNFHLNGNKLWWTKCVPAYLSQFGSYQDEFKKNRLTLKDSENFSIIEWFLYTCVNKNGEMLAFTEQEVSEIYGSIFNSNLSVLNEMQPKQAMSLLSTILSDKSRTDYAEKLIKKLFTNMTNEFISSEPAANLEHPLNMILQANLLHKCPTSNDHLDSKIFREFTGSEDLNYPLLTQLLTDFLNELLAKNIPHAIALESTNLNFNTLELILYHQRTYFDFEQETVMSGTNSLYNKKGLNNKKIIWKCVLL